MAKCPALPQPSGGSLSQLLANHTQVARLYHQCRQDHSDLVDAVRQQQRTPSSGN